MKVTNYLRPTYLPALTKEEWAVFRGEEENFFQRYNLHRVIPLWRRIGMALHTLAVYKSCGVHGFRKDEAEAVNHYQKACQYFPHEHCSSPELRKSLGLCLVDSCLCDL